MSERFTTIAARLLEPIRMEAAGQEEACGLLLARPGSSSLNDRVAYPGPFFARRFELDPEWMLRTFLAQRQRGWEAVGYYHTHPPGEAIRPSADDLRGHPFGALVLLVGEGGWRVYRTGLGEWTEVALRELPESARVLPG